MGRVRKAVSVALLCTLACGTTGSGESTSSSGGADNPVGAVRNVLRLQQEHRLTEALSYVRREDHPLWVAMVYRTISALVELSKAVTELSHGKIDRGARRASATLANLRTKYRLPAVGTTDPITSPDDYERDVRAVAGALQPSEAAALATELAVLLTTMSAHEPPKPRKMDFETHQEQGDHALVAFKGAPPHMRWQVTRLGARWYVNVESMLTVTIAAARSDNQERARKP